MYFDEFRYASIVRMADQAEQVRATYNSIISVLGPLVRSVPKDAMEKVDLASNSIVSGRSFRYKVMTFNTQRIFFSHIHTCVLSQNKKAHSKHSQA